MNSQLLNKDKTSAFFLKIPLIEAIARIGIFGTFLGHGIVAIGVNPKWIPLLASFGFRFVIGVLAEERANSKVPARPTATLVSDVEPRLRGTPYLISFISRFLEPSHDSPRLNYDVSSSS